MTEVLQLLAGLALASVLFWQTARTWGDPS